MKISVNEFIFWGAVLVSIVMVSFIWINNDISLKQLDQKCNGNECTYKLELKNLSDEDISAYVNIIGFTSVGYGKNASEKQVTSRRDVYQLKAKEVKKVEGMIKADVELLRLFITSGES